jgi:hypothetical protein
MHSWFLYLRFFSKLIVCPPVSSPKICKACFEIENVSSFISLSHVFVYEGVMAFWHAAVHFLPALLMSQNLNVTLYFQLSTFLGNVPIEDCSETHTFVQTTVQGGSPRKNGSRTPTRHLHQKRKQEQCLMKSGVSVNRRNSWRRVAFTWTAK